MLLRFVIHVIDEDSGRRRGIFHAAADLRESNVVTAQDRKQLVALRDWFNDHLERPSTFAVSKKPHAKAQAVSWFKSSATEHVSRMWEFVEVLSRYDVQVDVLRTKRPGYVVYEDEHQVTAYPFSDTPT